MQKFEIQFCTAQYNTLESIIGVIVPSMIFVNNIWALLDI